MNYIWDKKDSQFVEFKQVFNCKKNDCKLRITADFRYVVYLNSHFIANGQYADIPTHKIIETLDLNEYIIEGENTLFIYAFHPSEDYAVYKSKLPSLAFEVINNKQVICYSSKLTLSRKSSKYSIGDLITPELGLGYNIDFTLNDNEWESSKIVNVLYNEEDRKLPKSIVKNRQKGSIIAQGEYKLNGGNTTAELMQKAWLSSLSYYELTGKSKIDNNGIYPQTFINNNSNGIYVIVDLKKECAGYIYFDINVEKDTTMLLGWGEHLTDLRVRTNIKDRNFASRIELKKGNNKLEEYLFRVGCRYLCIFIESNYFTINDIGIIKDEYPLKDIKKEFNDRLLNKIYEVGKDTLSLCIHEHYEDCPWREQALYGMDSRNQMLFGYSVFNEYEMPRESMLMLGRSLTKDGLCEMCPPAQISITIPSFSAYWLIAIYDNYLVDYNEKFIKEIIPYAEEVINFFIKIQNNNTLIALSEERFWNFHEWTNGLDGGEIWRDKVINVKNDACLTALVYMGVKGIIEIEKKLNRENVIEKYLEFANLLAIGLKTFYDETKMVYASYIENGKLVGYHAYTQALMLCTGLVEEDKSSYLRGVLKNPNGIVDDMTIAGLPMKYDALMQDQNNLNFVVEDICKIFGEMLYNGATSFWETQKGEADFDGAGSLCHGWAAIGCYVLNKYYKK